MLWPVFGYAQDERTGLLGVGRALAAGGSFQGGDPERATRKRVWPFYSSYQGDGLTSKWVAWPLVNWRHEEYEDGTKDTFKAFPLWRSYEPGADLRDAPSPPGRWGPSATARPGPSAGSGRRPEQSDVHVIDLNPFPDYEFVDEHYAWLWELYTRRRNRRRGPQLAPGSACGGARSDADEDRRSLSFLWSARDYTRAGLERARERSLLFGLLRYRTTEARGLRAAAARPSRGRAGPCARTPSSTALTRWAPTRGPALDPALEPALEPAPPSEGGPWPDRRQPWTCAEG